MNDSSIISKEELEKRCALYICELQCFVDDMISSDATKENYELLQKLRNVLGGR